LQPPRAGKTYPKHSEVDKTELIFAVNRLETKKEEVGSSLARSQSDYLVVFA